eukprot:SAG11_NODE_402_length_9751_cov_7.372047_8_plen_307_part_00
MPLNHTRAFVAQSFIQATFELGSPKSAVLGVDPSSKTSVQKRAETVVMVVFYKLKIVLTGQLLKLVWKFSLPVIVVTWLSSYAAAVASCFWDTLICTVIMDEVEMRATGVTAAEVFNEVMSSALFSDGGSDGLPKQVQGLSNHCRLQLARAVGVAIHEEGTMYPPMELLLRHTIQYLKIGGSRAIQLPGNLDNKSEILAGLKRLKPPEQHAVACVHLLAVLLDGYISQVEVNTLQEIAVRAPSVVESGDGLGRRCADLAHRWRTRQHVAAEDLSAALYPQSADHVAPRDCMRLLEEFWNQMTHSLV